MEPLTLRQLHDEIVPLFDQAKGQYGFRRRATFPDGKEYQVAFAFDAKTVPEYVEELNRVMAATLVAFARKWERVNAEPAC